jgi:hypothetical protein
MNILKMEVDDLNIMEQENLQEYIKDKYVYEKLVSYFSRHELIMNTSAGKVTFLNSEGCFHAMKMDNQY